MPELLRRQPDVAVVSRQHLLDEDALRFLEREILVRRSRRRAARPQAEVPRRDRAARRIRHQHGALDGVRQLADVAGPAVRLHQRQRVSRRTP